MKREILRSLIRTAGYHGDHATFTRLYIENRISKRSADEAFRSGEQARAAGVKCTCSDCRAALRAITTTSESAAEIQTHAEMRRRFDVTDEVQS